MPSCSPFQLPGILTPGCVGRCTSLVLSCSCCWSGYVWGSFACRVFSKPQVNLMVKAERHRWLWWWNSIYSFPCSKPYSKWTLFSLHPSISSKNNVFPFCMKADFASLTAFTGVHFLLLPILQPLFLSLGPMNLWRSCPASPRHIWILFEPSLRWAMRAHLLRRVQCCSGILVAWAIFLHFNSVSFPIIWRVKARPYTWFLATLSETTNQTGKSIVSLVMQSYISALGH